MCLVSEAAVAGSGGPRPSHLIRPLSSGPRASREPVPTTTRLRGVRGLLGGLLSCRPAQVAYIWWAGLGGRVWATPSWKAFANWGRFASLAYPAALMRCMEGFCFSGMTVVAGAPSRPLSHHLSRLACTVTRVDTRDERTLHAVNAPVVVQPSYPRQGQTCVSGWLAGDLTAPGVTKC